MVMHYHAIVMGVMPDGIAVAEFGWMGVDLFFALSGFLIGGQLFRAFVRGEPEHFRTTTLVPSARGIAG